jgi:recombinational DNA repair protein RecR
MAKEAKREYKCPSCGNISTKDKNCEQCGRKGHNQLVTAVEIPAPDKNQLKQLEQLLKTYGYAWVLEKIEQGLQYDFELTAEPNFLEVESVEQANNVNLAVYRLLSYSDRLGKYVFCKRSRK